MPILGLLKCKENAPGEYEVIATTWVSVQGQSVGYECDNCLIKVSTGTNLIKSNAWTISDMSRGMRFPTMWHFDMCRHGRASAASCKA